MDKLRESILSAQNILSMHHSQAEETTTKQVIEIALDRLKIALDSIPQVEGVVS